LIFIELVWLIIIGTLEHWNIGVIRVLEHVIKCSHAHMLPCSHAKLRHFGIIKAKGYSNHYFTTLENYGKLLTSQESSLASAGAGYAA